MGCGVMCGDTVTLDSVTFRKSKLALQLLLPQLNQNNSLIQLQSCTKFIKQYHQQSPKFHLKPKNQLTSKEQFPQSVLVKWKIILFGLGGENKIYCRCLGITDIASDFDNDKQKEQSDSNSNSPLYHECFIQIEKDLQRTFTLQDNRKKQFESVLKRIANHFPSMGYTQGINFLISYLIIIGYSQNDTFWIFVHLAINRRYLLLGLYEDGFPLSNVFTVIFKNVLKRHNEALFNHFFNQLGVDTSLWVFKWFMTCYLYSFPMELIKFVWDFFIQIGCLGIVVFAISLTKQLSPILLNITQFSDISQFFLSLKELQVFNSHINLQRVVNQAYELEVILKDFDGVEEVGDFYGQFLKYTFQKDKNKKDSKLQDNSLISQYNHEMEKKINSWYQKLIEERTNFKCKSTNKDPILPIQSAQKQKSPQYKKDDFQLKILPVQYSSIESITIKNQLKPSNQLNVPTIASETNKVDYGFHSIHQRYQQETKSIPSNKSKKHKNIDSPQMDQLDRLSYNFDKKINNLKGRTYASNSRVDKQLKRLQQKKINIPSYEGVKINNFGIKGNNTLSFAAQNILKNQSSSFDAVSISSKHATNRSKTRHPNAPTVVDVQKESKNNRICGCKTKTQQNKFSSVEQSDLEQSKDQFSEDSVNNNKFFNNQIINELKSFQNYDSHRQRLSTYNDYMINSQGPAALQKKTSVQQIDVEKKIDIDIEVEVLPFKKDKRLKGNRMIQPQKNKRESRDMLFRIGCQNQEDSVESLHQISCDRISQVNSQLSRAENNCEIESVR